MAVQSTRQTSEQIDADKVREELDKILASRYFVNAHKKKHFLRVICDFYLAGRAQELNEYVLGYDVFERDNTYNPSADPIVRVVAHEVRKKLDSYYQNEGANDEIRLEIPAGSYQPVFTRHVPQPGQVAGENPAPSAPGVEALLEPRRLRGVATGLGLAVLGLAITVIVLALSNRGLRQQAAITSASSDPAMHGGEMWGTFLKDNIPPVVVLSNPVVPRFANASDPELLLKEAIPLDQEAREMLQKKVIPNRGLLIPESGGSGSENVKGQQSPAAPGQLISRIILSNNFYTGIGEAIGLHHLNNFFHSAGREIILKQSRTLSAEDLKNRNVILLGGAWVNEWSGKLPENEDFVYSSNARVVNRNPQSGEEREYTPQFDGRTGGLTTDYALITVKQNLTETRQVMVLSGIYSEGTEAAAEYVTNKTHLDHLNQRLRQARESGEPPYYFQALLKVGVENGIPTTISIVALHKLSQLER
ncbi:MAG TPA: hypothetical protein VFD58_10745 [Blastocatellia bacterium]|nr:hypothetical protein [Blastocatellia bacterium]